MKAMTVPLPCRAIPACTPESLSGHGARGALLATIVAILMTPTRTRRGGRSGCSVAESPRTEAGRLPSSVPAAGVGGCADRPGGTGRFDPGGGLPARALAWDGGYGWSLGSSSCLSQNLPRRTWTRRAPWQHITAKSLLTLW